MSTKSALQLALLAGTVVGTTTMAQELQPVDLTQVTGEVKHLDPNGNEIPAPPYADRAIGRVFDNGFAIGGINTAVNLGTCHILDDFDLTGGPMANQATKRITGIGFSTVTAGCTGSQQFDFLIELYPSTGADYTAANMMLTAPIWSARYTLTQNCGVYSLWTVNLAPNGVGGTGDVSFLLPSNQGFIRVRYVEVGTTTLRPYASAGTGTQTQSFYLVNGLPSNNVGTITPSYGRDINGDGSGTVYPHVGGNPSGLLGGTPVITGAAAGAHEHRQAQASPALSYLMMLQGDVICNTPAVVTNVGDLANGTTSVNGTLAANEVKWYSFNIGPVADAALTYLDIDTETSAVVTDTTMALYDANGGLVTDTPGGVFAIDAGDGSGNLANLSFGIGRRAPVGDGLDYDGRDGQLVAGTYYLAVGGSQVSSGACFGASSTSPDTGDFTVRFRTNASVSGAVPPEASVAPSLVQDFGTLVSPGAESGDTNLDPLTVKWWKFNLAEPTDATTYVDLTTGNVVALDGTDTEISVYDAAGTMIATDDDDSTDLYSALSFGNPTNPRPADPQGTGTAAGLAYDGRDGDLAAGDYYVAVSLFDMTPGADRWHVRTDTGSGLSATLTAFTNSDGVGTQCPGNECGPQDYNGDGDSGTDQDIEAFFACLGGNCCATCFCQGSDFNGDGDFGTDQDIEAFFRVLGGASC